MNFSLRPLLVKLCRIYQSLFAGGHPEEGRLVGLDQAGNKGDFLREYFDHEVIKGSQYLGRFSGHEGDLAPQEVLDFGCGGGGMTFLLGGLCREAWGVDIDAEKLAFAEQEVLGRGSRNVRFRIASDARIPFDDESFDCVLCVDVIEHLPDPAHFLKEFYRVLRPSGRLLLSFGPPWFHPHGKHMWTRLPGYWTHLLFPRSVVMEVRGYPAETTWEDIGIHRLSVGKFHRALRASGFETQFVTHRLKPCLRPIGLVPLIRELFISDVVGVFHKPEPEPRPRVPSLRQEAAEC